MGSMDVSFILFHFNHSTLTHFSVFQLDRKSDEISKSGMLFDQSWKYIPSTRIQLVYVISFCHMYGKFPIQRCT